MTVLAAAVMSAALSCLAQGGPLARIAAAVPQLSRAAALREKSWRAAFLRQRDPDAAGRPGPGRLRRPRRPSAVSR